MYLSTCLKTKRLLSKKTIVQSPYVPGVDGFKNMSVSLAYFYYFLKKIPETGWHQEGHHRRLSQSLMPKWRDKATIRKIKSRRSRERDSPQRQEEWNGGHTVVALDPGNKLRGRNAPVHSTRASLLWRLPLTSYIPPDFISRSSAPLLTLSFWDFSGFSKSADWCITISELGVPQGCPLAPGSIHMSGSPSSQKEIFQYYARKWCLL